MLSNYIKEQKELNKLHLPIKQLTIMSSCENLSAVLKQLNAYKTDNFTDVQKAAWSKFIKLVENNIAQQEFLLEQKIDKSALKQIKKQANSEVAQVATSSKVDQANLKTNKREEKLQLKAQLKAERALNKQQSAERKENTKTEPRVKTVAQKPVQQNKLTLSEREQLKQQIKAERAILKAKDIAEYNEIKAQRKEIRLQVKAQRHAKHVNAKIKNNDAMHAKNEAIEKPASTATNSTKHTKTKKNLKNQKVLTKSTPEIIPVVKTPIKQSMPKKNSKVITKSTKATAASEPKAIAKKTKK